MFEDHFKNDKLSTFIDETFYWHTCLFYRRYIHPYARQEAIPKFWRTRVWSSFQHFGAQTPHITKNNPKSTSQKTTLHSQILITYAMPNKSKHCLITIVVARHRSSRLSISSLPNTRHCVTNSDVAMAVLYK